MNVIYRTWYHSGDTYTEWVLPVLETAGLHAELPLIGGNVCCGVRNPQTPFVHTNQ